MTDVSQNSAIRGMISAAYITGYRIAIIVSGALALILAQHMGWHVTYLIMSALMLIGMITTFLTHEPTTPAKIHHGFYEDVVQPFTEFFTRKSILIGIALIIVMILYKLGDAFTLSLSTTFFLRDLHFSLTDVGSVNKGIGMGASIAGGILAGIWMIRLNLFRALVAFGLLQAFSNLAFMWLAMMGHHFWGLSLAVFLENFCSGLGNTAFVALIMTLCNPRFSATQFALLTALSAIGRVYIGPLAAMMVEHMGWVWFYFSTFLIGVPALILLVWLHSKINLEAISS